MGLLSHKDQRPGYRTGCDPVLQRQDKERALDVEINLEQDWVQAGEEIRGTDSARGCKRPGKIHLNCKKTLTSRDVGGSLKPQ